MASVFPMICAAQWRCCKPEKRQISEIAHSVRKSDHADAIHTDLRKRNDHSDGSKHAQEAELRNVRCDRERQPDRSPFIPPADTPVQKERAANHASIAQQGSQVVEFCSC